MKKVLMSLAAVAAVFAGCQKPELEVAPVEVKDAFTASVENFDATKTALDGNHVVWSAADQLAIFQGFGVADLYEIADASAGSSSAKFVHKTSGLGDDFFGGVEMNDPRNVAFYPYAEGLGAYSEEGAWVVTNVTLPATQVYSENSFGNGAFPMVAVTETMDDHNLRFKNVLGAVKFQFTGSAVVKSIALKGNNGEVLAGKATVTAHDGFETPSVVLAGDGATEVVLDCGEGVQLSSEATNFVVALPPVKFEKGFTATVTYTNGKTYTVEATAANEVLRSGILAMPEVELWASSEKLGDVTLAANTSLVDADLKISVDNAKSFYGIYLQKEMWDMYGPMFDEENFKFGDVLNGTYADMFPTTLYEGSSVEVKLSQLGFAPEYLEYDYCNTLMPNMASYVMVVPVVEGKETYTQADAVLFEVATNSLVVGGDFVLPEFTITKGYSTSDVVFAGSEDVIYMLYDIYDADAELPTQENYLEELAWAYDARYSSVEGCTVEVDNSYGVLPGASYKLCVAAANAKGETVFQVIDVETLPIAYNESLVVTVSKPEYDDIDNSASFTVNVPEGAVKLYYTLNASLSYTEYNASVALVGIIEGTTSFDSVDITAAGDVQLSLPITQNKYGAKKVAVHVACVDAEGKVSQWVSSETLEAPQYPAPAAN